jgi:hypothetical protein
MKNGIGKSILNKYVGLVLILLAFLSSNAHAAKNEWVFFINMQDLHVVGADHGLRHFSWFKKMHKFDNFCNGSFFTTRDAVGPYITDIKIKKSNVYKWWWIGWNCETAIMSNSILDLYKDKRLNYLLAGTPLLIRNGKLVSKKEMLESCSSKFFNRKCPRTVIGILKDKIIIYITTSASILDVQEKMREFGCSYALNLDGGGSTFIKTNTFQYPKKIKRKYPNFLAW